MEEGPKLTEPGIRNYLGKSLRDFHRFRDGYTSMWFNIGMLLAFLTVTGGVLYWRYKGRISPQEQAIRNRKKKEYIFTKLQTLSALKKQTKSGMITNLPLWDNHPDLGILNRKNV